jgi:hypothetical protein
MRARKVGIAGEKHRDDDGENEAAETMQPDAGELERVGEIGVLRGRERLLRRRDHVLAAGQRLDLRDQLVEGPRQRLRQVRRLVGHGRADDQPRDPQRHDDRGEHEGERRPVPRFRPPLHHLGQPGEKDAEENRREKNEQDLGGVPKQDRAGHDRDQPRADLPPLPHHRRDMRALLVPVIVRRHVALYSPPGGKASGCF